VEGGFEYSEELDKTRRNRYEPAQVWPGKYCEDKAAINTVTPQHNDPILKTLVLN